jgi:hypothetical protein
MLEFAASALQSAKQMTLAAACMLSPTLPATQLLTAKSIYLTVFERDILQPVPMLPVCARSARGTHCMPLTALTSQPDTAGCHHAPPLEPDAADEVADNKCQLVEALTDSTIDLSKSASSPAPGRPSRWQQARQQTAER